MLNNTHDQPGTTSAGLFVLQYPNFLTRVPFSSDMILRRGLQIGLEFG
jgi:hypothetical protein